MQVVNIKNNSNYLKEYIELCSLEWGHKKSKEEMEKDYLVIVLYLIKKKKEY